MNHRERKLWQWLSGQIGNAWDAQRHEDKYAVGIPDVSYGCRGTQGWIELKSLTAWPRKGFPALSVEQTNWLIRRGGTGGKCWLLVDYNDMLLLFPWNVIPILQDNEDDFVGAQKLTSWYGYKKIFDTNEFLYYLTGGKYGRNG